jgi:cytochrome c oxidase assembly factor CtaG
VPGGVQRELWLSVTWPLAGLIFWWIAGRAIDALRAARSCAIAPRITRVETLVALLLFAALGLLIVGMLVDPSMRSELTLPWRLDMAGSIMWIVLAAPTIVARIAQWRINTRIKPETAAQTIPAQP